MNEFTHARLADILETIQQGQATALAHDEYPAKAGTLEAVVSYTIYGLESLLGLSAPAPSLVDWLTDDEAPTYNVVMLVEALEAEEVEHTYPF